MRACADAKVMAARARFPSPVAVSPNSTAARLSRAASPACSRALKNLASRFASAIAGLAIVVSFVSTTHADSKVPALTDPAPFTAKELRQGYREGVVLAKPRIGHQGSADSAEAREGLRVRRRWERFDGLRLLEVREGETPLHAVERLRATGRYDYVHVNTIRSATASPNDPDFSRQWGLSNNGSSNGVPGADIGAARAWDVRTDASNIIVAVIDSGVRYDHPDLAANMWTNPREIPANGRDDDGNGYIDDVYGINAIPTRNSPTAGDPRDDHGHGTHVAGIIGAVGNNGTGISGVAWRVKIMALKFLRGSTNATTANPAGRGTTADAIECIDYAIANGAHIINASYGAASGSATQFDPAEYDAIRKARDAGIIFVAAAGNDAADMDLLAHYPASHRLENIVSVANSTNRDDLPVSTNFGSGSVELFAPGSDIYSLGYETATPYIARSGTSMAAPHVAGAFALLKAQFPNDSYRQLINRVLRSVDPAAAFAGRVQTGGRLNLDRALRSSDNRPFNDDFATRARLRGTNLAIRSVNTGASIEAEPALAGAAASATLWWEWTPAITATVRVSTDGSVYDSLVGVFTGTALDALTPVAANDNDGSKLTSRLEFLAQAGTTYQIAVGSKTGATGLTLLDIGAIPPNDTFANAQTISGRSTAIYAANAQATLEAGEPRIRGFSGGKSLWYRWTAPATGRFQFGLKSDGFDPLLAIYTGTTLNALSLVASSDNADAEAGGTADHTDALVTVDASVGVTYFIQVDGKATGTTPPTNAPFTLTLNDSLWQGVTGSSVTSAPTVGPDGAVYIGSTDGWFHAFNADGRRRWPALNFQGSQDTSSAALAPNGILYVGAGPSTGNNAKLYAIDSTNGIIRWETIVGNGQNANNAIALAADGTIYVHSDEGRLFAFADTGAGATQKWSVSVPGMSYASVSIAPDGTLYLGADEGPSATRHRFFALNPSDGAVKWTFDADNAIYTAAAIDAAGNVYFGTLTSGRLYSLTSTGQQRWVYTVARLGTSSSPALSPDGTTVYFAGYDGVLHAVNTANGAARWTFPLGKEVRASSPAVDANGTVYIGAYDNLLYAVNADGTLRRTWSTGNIVRSSPGIAGTTLYVGSNDNSVYAFDIGASTAGAWPQYRHNARRTGRAIAEPPAIARSPEPQAVIAGRSLELSVSATGSGPLTYQWFKDGAAIAGATNPTFTLASLSSADTGNYAAAVTSALGTAFSAPAPVVVRGASDPLLAPRLVNLSVRTSAGTSDRTLIVGFFLSGTAEKPILLRAIGPTLADFGVAAPLTDPRLQLLSGTSMLAENDNWLGASALATAFTQVGAFPLAPTSPDSALLRPLSPGGYTAQVSGSGSAGIALAELYEIADTGSARLANVSARSQVNTGADVLIAGFTVSGNAPKRILVRAIGPSLSGLGVAGALTDPRLTVFQGAATLDENDNWSGRPALTEAFRAVGAFPLSAASRDAALLITLAPGSYTAQVSGVNGTTGVALVEVYELDAP
jgi:subtilisin family serine protease/outer membrane protein assembly factor BamB